MKKLKMRKSRNACNTFIGLSYPFKGRLSWAAQTRYEIEHIFALLLGRTGVSFLTHQMALLIFKFASWKSDYQYQIFLRLNFSYLTKLLNVLNLSWTLMSKFIPHTFVEKCFFLTLDNDAHNEFDFFLKLQFFVSFMQ